MASCRWPRCCGGAAFVCRSVHHLSAIWQPISSRPSLTETSVLLCSDQPPKRRSETLRNNFSRAPCARKSSCKTGRRSTWMVDGLHACPVVDSCVFEDLQSEFLYYLLDVDGLYIADPVSILEIDDGLVWLVLMHIAKDLLANNRGHRLLVLLFFSATWGLIIDMSFFTGHLALFQEQFLVAQSQCFAPFCQ